MARSAGAVRERRYQACKRYARLEVHGTLQMPPVFATKLRQGMAVSMISAIRTLSRLAPIAALFPSG
jgi:hypothetical protein